MKKYHLLFLAILFAPTIISSAEATPFIPADDPHYYYDFNVGTYGYQAIFGDRVVGHGEYGSFTAHFDDITFFIVDQGNYDKYVADESYSRYCVREDVVDGEFEFRYPYADTWYRVFCNKDNLFAKDITFDLYYDRTPPDITLNLDTGATYSGIKEISVTASDVTFSVWKINLQYYLNGWQSVKTEYNSESLSYNWDTKDWDNGDVRWRVVAEDTVNNEAEVEALVTVYNYVAPTTTTGTTTTTGGQATTSLPMQFDSTVLMLLGIVGLVVIAGVAISLQGKKSHLGSHKLDSPVIKEKEITTRVLVVCPFCGSKNEQGITKCSFCQGKL